ncbi:LysR substrate-binding domain-containing protein [Burkholderia sp. Ac-20379]|uniref:LysR substrate-binding domain-containing protein n=1 Tax=Burkholderia sp. Ac-20379 TaxID=2703900 RepID=UPI001981DBA8|nr:LysR substrate-binding domain-containing protein [Burkholderia sp. Ac-20379]MBN3724607.1 LysR family transcriptional regulator [Burkholderia sp. Ac-20379]
MFHAPSMQSLLCFEASARLRSFTAAAHELHLTQGAVSRQIQTLEERLGVAMFVRRRDAMTLTDAGREYFAEIEPLLKRLERATVNVMALKGRGGALSLSVGSSIGNYWLIPRLPAFTREHGEITLNIRTRVGAVDFSQASVDASLEFGDGRRPGMHCEFVAPLALLPYAAPQWVREHGAAVGACTPRGALIQHLTLDGAWDAWFAHDGIAAEAGNEGPRYEIMSMALNAAVGGLGATLLPPFMVADQVAAGRLVALSSKPWRHPAKAYYLVYPETSAGMKALTIFREWLLGQAGEGAEG